MKKGRIFAAVVYYLFMFFIGILMALFLPYFYMYYGESVNYIQQSLEGGQFSDAMSVVGGYYDERYVFQQNFDNGGIVVFPAATLKDGMDSDGNTITDRYLQYSYGVFVYDVDDYNVTKTDDNKTIVIVTDVAGNGKKVDILNTDTDNNGTKDTIATVIQNGFLYVDLVKSEVDSVTKIELIDCDGNVYRSVVLTSALDFSENFFHDVAEFVDLYNSPYPPTDAEMEKLEDKLYEADAKLRSLDEHYKKSTDGVVKSNADKKSTVAVVIYFVCVYIIGDLLVGKRYTVKFVKFVLVKVFKVKFKPKKPKYEEPAFGSDYNCQVTLQADFTELVDGKFDSGVQIRYTRDGVETAFTLLKDNNYTQTISLKAGCYVNLWVDLDSRYATQNLPDTLIAEGYRKIIKFKILKREE